MRPLVRDFFQFFDNLRRFPKTSGDCRKTPDASVFEVPGVEQFVVFTAFATPGVLRTTGVGHFFDSRLRFRLHHPPMSEVLRCRSQSACFSFTIGVISFKRIEIKNPFYETNLKSSFLVWPLILFALSSCQRSDNMKEKEKTAAEQHAFVGRESCKECHPLQYEQFIGRDQRCAV